MTSYSKFLILFIFFASIGSFAETLNCKKHLEAQGSFKELTTILNAPTFSGDELITFLSNYDSKLKDLFEADAGVSEKYSIKEHTLMVYDTFLEQLPYYEKYFKRILGINVKKTFKFLIAVHDIGKPIAIEKENKDAQHKYTDPIVHKLMVELRFSKKEIALARALIDNDILGDLVKGNISPQTAQVQLSQVADGLFINPLDYFYVQLFFYTIDASSYPKLRKNVFFENNGMLIPERYNLKVLEGLLK